MSAFRSGSLLVCALLAAPGVAADSWVEGSDASLAGAIAGAYQAAKVRVQAHEAACLGGRGDDADVRMQVPRDGRYVVEVYVSADEEACRQRADDLTPALFAFGADYGVPRLQLRLALLRHRVAPTDGAPGRVEAPDLESRSDGAGGPQRARRRTRAPSVPATAPVQQDELAVRAARLFAGPGQFPPSGFTAYGIIAFTSATTVASVGRYIAICKAYLAALPESSTLTARGVREDQQMVTVWPTRDAEAAAGLNGASDERTCARAVIDLDLAASRDAIAKARHLTGGSLFENRGPFLLAWSPGRTMGRDDALVLAWDLSNVTTVENATDRFTQWATRIEMDPSLWSEEGWALRKLRWNIRELADRWGEDIVTLLGISGAQEDE